MLTIYPDTIHNNYYLFQLSINRCSKIIKSASSCRTGLLGEPQIVLSQAIRNYFHYFLVGITLLVSVRLLPLYARFLPLFFR